jgi:plastocyanin
MLPTSKVAKRSLAALATATAIAACSSSTTSPTSTTRPNTSPAHTSTGPPAKTATVSISDYAYDPADITVASGAKVTFTNHDQTAHTATTQHGGFDTGTINPGHRATVTLTTPGTYAYYCQFHPFMHGTLTVK